MNIILAQNFEYHEGLRKEAYVENGILHMPMVSFENIMYSLTYAIKGNTKCYYCGRHLEPKRCTLDHIYPRAFGGVSIPNNLVPCCAKCNDRKSDLLPQQYKEIKKIQDKRKRIRKEEIYREENAQQKTKQGVILPKAWYEMKSNYSVIGTFTSEQPTKSSRKYQRLQEQYETYGQICRPVVVSANRFVLDGFMVLFLIKNLGIEISVPFITLDNVIVDI